MDPRSYPSVDWLFRNRRSATVRCWFLLSLRLHRYLACLPTRQRSLRRSPPLRRWPLLPPKPSLRRSLPCPVSPHQLPNCRRSWFRRSPGHLRFPVGYRRRWRPYRRCLTALQRGLLKSRRQKGEEPGAQGKSVESQWTLFREDRERTLVFFWRWGTQFRYRTPESRILRHGRSSQAGPLTIGSSERRN